MNLKLNVDTTCLEEMRILDMPVHRKLYPEWVDKMMPLPRGFKTRDVTTFSGEDSKSTMEHICRFTARYGEANQNEYYKL